MFASFSLYLLSQTKANTANVYFLKYYLIIDLGSFVYSKSSSLLYSFVSNGFYVVCINEMVKIMKRSTETDAAFGAILQESFISMCTVGGVGYPLLGAIGCHMSNNIEVWCLLLIVRESFHLVTLTELVYEKFMYCLI